MHRGVSVTVAALLVLILEPALAQDKPLQVEIVTTAPHQREPNLVHITNLTTKTIELAFPLYFYGRTSLYRQTVPSDPVDVERRKRLGWDEVPSALPSRLPRPSPQIEPGERKEYEFGVLGAGEYRVRVWYVVSPPQPGPPPRSPSYEASLPAPIRVN